MVGAAIEMGFAALFVAQIVFPVVRHAGWPGVLRGPVSRHQQRAVFESDDCPAHHVPLLCTVVQRVDDNRFRPGSAFVHALAAHSAGNGPTAMDIRFCVGADQIALRCPTDARPDLVLAIVT